MEGDSAFCVFKAVPTSAEHFMAAIAMIWPWVGTALQLKPVAGPQHDSWRVALFSFAGPLKQLMLRELKLLLS